MWCGGNELFNVWSGMTDQHKALRLLNRNCYDLDPETPFLPTSPVMGVGHGDYRFVDDNGRECFQMFTEAGCSAYPEFGCPGPSDFDYIQTFIPPDVLDPPRPGTAWETHHAFGAWGVAPESWLFPSVIESYFGPLENTAALIEKGQWLQAEGYRCLFEEARRQKPQASMALNWCFNEPWPSAANNSLLNWPHRAKPALATVKAACRPVLASARVPKFSWQAGELMPVELFVLNDSPMPVEPLQLLLTVRLDDSDISTLTWDVPLLPPNNNAVGPIANVPLPEGRNQTLELHLSVVNRPDMDSMYRLCFKPHAKRAKVRVGFVNNA